MLGIFMITVNTRKPKFKVVEWFVMFRNDNDVFEINDIGGTDSVEIPMLIKDLERAVL